MTILEIFGRSPHQKAIDNRVRQQFRCWYMVQEMANAFEILKASATHGNVGGQSPLDIFYGKLDRQVALAKEVKDGKTHNSRSLWFRKDGTSYVVRIGRTDFEIAGSILFRATDIDQVVVILTAAKEAIAADKKLQDTIALHSLERSERLEKGATKKSDRPVRSRNRTEPAGNGGL